MTTQDAYISSGESRNPFINLYLPLASWEGHPQHSHIVRSMLRSHLGKNQIHFQFLLIQESEDILTEQFEKLDPPMPNVNSQGGTDDKGRTASSSKKRNELSCRMNPSKMNNKRKPTRIAIFEYSNTRGQRMCYLGVIDLLYMFDTYIFLIYTVHWRRKQKNKFRPQQHGPFHKKTQPKTICRRDRS